MSLPKEVNYMDKSELPKGTTNTTIIITPQTGNLTYNASGQLIQFNLPIRGYLVPNTLYLRYKMTATITGGGTFGAATVVAGSFPGYSPFLRMETLIGSNVVESISNYNMLNQLILTCKTHYARKFGLAAMMAIGGGGNPPPALTTSNTNAYTPTAGNTTEDIFVAIPINCLFGNADKLVPLKFMPATSLNFYLDAVGNFAPGITTAGLSNCELCFDVIEFGADVDGAVLSMVDERGKLVLKSQSYMVSQQNVSQGISGTNEYIYSMRLASIKSLFLNIGGTNAASVNKTFDSFDVTMKTGSYQFFIAGTPYPSREISTILNKAGVLAELAMAIDGTNDPSQANFSITPVEFNYLSNATTTALLPAKFYVGTNVERLASSAMLTGISSQLSPISVRLVNSTASAAAHTMALIAHYDVLIEIDPINRQAVVLQ